jgi:hypothetical protein
MPTKRARSVRDSDDQPQLVRLTGPGGFLVPERWTEQRRLDGDIALTLSVVVIDGEPRVESAALHPEAGAALSPAAARRFGLDAPLESSVRSRVLLNMAPDQPKLSAALGRAITTRTDVLDQDGMAAAWAEAGREARSAVRRKRITSDDLRNVLDLYTEGGIHLVMSKLEYSERNARRLLSRARRELSS